MVAALVPLRRCFDFSGRSNRTEFWSFFLLAALVAALSYGLDNAGYWLLGTDLYSWELSSLLGDVGRVVALVALMLFPLPMLALTVRRLHDIDESGWFVVIALVPLGVFVLFPVMLLPGSEEENRFG
ncbi:DUF805 domain-containing protein [Stenotrophomonas indicatrix]|uniref:DUF805 domain-containing protein n=1 Tax=Stenotrophomonas indicatrix TaxID=2045451 RepID=UPI002654C230|nr:DUF805 domain-containing protein [Stenotrophomonas indicatrix]MDN8645332.1 DUF805 domain-containing protein [Stenotrophomonas indicatrix]MDN8655841.1 DUF805 domain-containing protein [Stenotrophomonas indicatrix]